MIIGILGAQGRVGRTTLAWSLARLLAEKGRVALYENDVAFPKLVSYLPWQGEEVKRKVTEIDPTKCKLVGKCLEACQFGIIKKEGNRLLHRLKLCRGCGSCREVCPEKAIFWKEVVTGELGKAEEGNLVLYAGRLAPEEGWEGYLARKLKETYPVSDDPAVLKAPFGLSAASLRTVKEAEALILITRPHPTLSDEIKTFGEILQGFGLPGGVVVNFSQEIPQEISSLAGSWGLKSWAIPRLKDLLPRKTFFEVAPELRPILEEIVTLGGGA